jgi:multiple sugar transport system ATP-binding protein
MASPASAHPEASPRGPLDGVRPREGASGTGAVTLRSIGKQFGSVAVLRNLDLDIRPGEFVTILGPSGCGKSTLLRIIAGLEQQSSGTVAIDGAIVDGRRPDERDIAMVFQSYALYPHLSVFDNIAVPLRMRRLNAYQRLPGAAWVGSVRRTTEEIATAVRAVATTLRIEPLLERKPAQLSGGQKQRVALARAMVRKPRAFLMDEPLSNLDAELRVHMRAEIAQLHRALGTTFIYVTHDQAEAMTMSDRVVLISGGEVLQVASPGAIYDDPDDLRVAQFVGTPRINILPAVATADGIDALGLVLPHRTRLATGTPLQVGIRPSRLAATDTGRGVAGRLVHRENLGSDLFLYVRAEGAAEPLIARGDPAETDRYVIGSELRLAVAPEHALLFDSEGRRVRLGSPGPRDGVHA